MYCWFIQKHQQVNKIKKYKNKILTKKIGWVAQTVEACVCHFSGIKYSLLLLQSLYAYDQEID